MFSRLLRRKTPETPPSTQGRLVYAVGDIHGRLDAFDALLHVIAQDALASQPSQQPMNVQQSNPASRRLVRSKTR